MLKSQLSKEFQLLIKSKILKKIKIFQAFKLSDVVCIMLINVKMPKIVGILTFMSMMNLMLSCVEHEKSFITLEPDCLSSQTSLNLCTASDKLVLHVECEDFHQNGQMSLHLAHRLFFWFCQMLAQLPLDNSLPNYLW